MPLYSSTTFISVEWWPLGVENWADHVLNGGLSEDNYRKCHWTNLNKLFEVLWFWINRHCRYQGGLSGKHLPFRQGLKKGTCIVCEMEEGSTAVKREVSEWSLWNGQCHLMLTGSPWWDCRKSGPGGREAMHVAISMWCLKNENPKLCIILKVDPIRENVSYLSVFSSSTFIAVCLLLICPWHLAGSQQYLEH